MEQHENKTALEQAYQAQREQEIPDLWDRIEQGFEEETKQLKRNKRNIRTRYMVLAAAVVLAIVIAVPILMHESRGEKSEEAHDNGMHMNVMEDTQADYDVAESVEEAKGAAESAEESVDAATECSKDDDLELQDETYATDGIGNTDMGNEDMSENADSGESYMYLLEGDDEIPAGSYKDIRCILLQEVNADGEYGNRVYVDLDDEEGDVARKLLVQYRILEWQGRETTPEGENSYLLGIGMEDETVVTRKYAAEDEFESRMFLQFAHALYKIKK